MILCLINYSKYKAQEENFKFWDELNNISRLGSNKTMTRAAFSMEEVAKVVQACYSNKSQAYAILRCIVSEAVKNGNTNVTCETAYVKDSAERAFYEKGCKRVPRVSGEGITIQDIIWGMYETNTTDTKILEVLRTLDYNQSKID